MGIEIVMTVFRIALGIFFAASGFNKLFDRQRHLTLYETLLADRIPMPRFNVWFVPLVELFGGLALVVGLLTPLVALSLLTICVVATCMDGLKQIPDLHPINKLDWIADFLYLPEVIYIFGLMLFVLYGSGPFGIDPFLMEYVR